MEAESSTSLGRGLQLLLALASDDRDGGAAAGRGVVELSRSLGREKSQVSRALKTLSEHGFVDRDPDTLDYRLGWRLFTLAAQAGHRRLIAVAPAVLRTLVASLGETAHLSVLDGPDVLTVISEASPSAVRVTDASGRRVPAHCTASGRALLLDHDADTLRALLGEGALPPAGPAAPPTVTDLRRRLASERARGLVVASDELEAGLVAVAAPVRDGQGRIVAALNLSAPKFRFERKLDDAAAQTRAAAGELSRELGWRPAHQPPCTDGHRSETPGGAP